MPRTANTFPQRKTVENLISNGDFEYAPPFTAATATTGRWIDGTAAGSSNSSSPYIWGLFGSSLSTAAQFDSAEKKSGTYSLKLSTLSGNRICTVAPQITTTTQGLFSVLPSTTYSYSFWMKTNRTSGSSAGAYIDFLERNGVGTAGLSHISTQVATTTDWTYYSGSFTTASTCRFIAPKIFVEGNTGTANLIMDAWFDDITLVKSPVQTRSTTNIARRKPVIGNMLYNGDFEILPTTNTAMTSSASAFIDGTAAGSSTNATYGWFVYNYNGTRSAIFDTTTKYAGNGSLKLTTDSGSIGVALHANVDNDASWSRNNFPCEPNTTYNLSVWIKTNLISGSATTGAAVIIAERNKTNATVSGGGRTIVSGIVTTTDWTQYTATITTLASTRFLNPQFQLIGNNGSATLNMEAWFDNLTINQSYPRKDVDNLLSNGNFEYIPPFTAATTTALRWVDGTAS
jgi:hypothetical protein